MIYPSDAIEDHSHIDQLLTIEDVSALLKVPKSWIYEHTRKRGDERLPYIKLGKYLRFRADQINFYLTNHSKNMYSSSRNT